jgi:hypothetical protein
MYGDFTHETFFTKRSFIQLFKAFDYSNINVYPQFPRYFSLKGKLALIIFKFFMNFYKQILYLESRNMAKNFIYTQNILAVVEK